MNAQATVGTNGAGDPSGPNAHAMAAAMSTKVRPFYWSLRRELWENRSIYFAPLAVATVVLVSALINLVSLPGGRVPFQQMLDISPHYLRLASLGLYGVIAVILGITAGIVGWFYCLDALYGERRERSVLFWKSLPISDTTAVLSKVLTGMIVVPLVAFVVGLALYVLLMILASVVLSVNGASGLQLFANSSFGEAFVVHVYASMAAILWSAPLYAWAIFVSSWVRRATFLWALLPPAAIGLAEGLAFGTNHFVKMVGERLSGGLKYAFVDSDEVKRQATLEFDNGSVDGNIDFGPTDLPDSLFSLLDPVRFLSQPGLWIGLAVAAAFVAGSIWMRRYREPL